MSRRTAYLVFPLLAVLAAFLLPRPAQIIADDDKPAPKSGTALGDDVKPSKGDGKEQGDKSGDKPGEEPRRWGRPGGFGDHRSSSDGRPPSRWEPFSTEELNEIIAAVQTKNAKLAEKMKERFADTLRRPPGSSMPKLSPEQIEKALAVFEDRSPEFAKRLRETLAENPDRLNAILAMQWERLKKMIELKEADPTMYKAQTDEIRKEDAVRGLIWRLRKLVSEKKPENQAEIDSLKEQLRTALVAKQKAENHVRELEIASLQQKIEKLNEEIAKENVNIEKGAEASLDRIMEWVNAPGPPRREGSRSEPVKSEEKT